LRRDARESRQDREKARPAMATPSPLGKDPANAPIDCALCPRLVAYRNEISAKEPSWFNGAVPSFGDPSAELLVVGLAPGLKGAHRTGRAFTGDWSGDLLYSTIGKFGFSSGTYGGRTDDGLQPKNAMLTNAVRCLPPQNKPIGAEINQCRSYLRAQIDALQNLKVLVLLGKVAHDSTIRSLGLKLKDHPFGHAARYETRLAERKISLISSYHCSRYNTNTKRLTPEMFEAVFAFVKAAMQAA